MANPFSCLRKTFSRLLFKLYHEVVGFFPRKMSSYTALQFSKLAFVKNQFLWLNHTVKTITTKTIITPIWLYICWFFPISHHNFIIGAQRAGDFFVQQTAMYSTILIHIWVFRLTSCPHALPPFLLSFSRPQNLQPFSPPRRDSSCLLQGKDRISKFGSLGLPSSCVLDQSSLLFHNNSRKACWRKKGWMQAMGMWAVKQQNQETHWKVREYSLYSFCPGSSVSSTKSTMAKAQDSQTHGIMESLRLEKTCKIIKPNYQAIAMFTIKLLCSPSKYVLTCHIHHCFNNSGMLTPSLLWAASSKAWKIFGKKFSW